ncbi:MAG: hypothetical protein R3E58_20645 [Phycisphaerae bacterium]|nr:hypothetical protein [Phycisphaerales bacterium]
MRIHCPSCGIQIPASDVNIDTAIAKCMGCNSVFGIKDAIEQDSTRHSRKRNRRDPVPMPSGIIIEDWGGNRRIVRKWYTPKYFILLFFCIAWDSFLIFWYSIAFGEHDTPWIMKVFPIAHVAVGIGLTYYTICGFLNRTIIELGSFTLSIRHKPLHWPGNADFDASQFDQLYCKENSRRQDNNGATQITYDLQAATKDGKSIKLLTGLPELELALYLEQEIESALGIVDRPVPGEAR